MMEYVYAAMLLHKSGQDITEDGVKDVLEAAGTEPDDGQVKALLAALDGVDIDEAIESAAAAPAAAPSGGSPSAEPSGGSDDSGDEAEAPADDEPEEEDDTSDEEAAEGLGALFG
jgi:large subunit ribosomal protein L12